MNALNPLPLPLAAFLVNPTTRSLLLSSPTHTKTPYNLYLKRSRPLNTHTTKPPQSVPLR